MKGYWIEFTDGTAGYCEGSTPYHAIRIAEHFTKKTAKFEGKNIYDPVLKTLPYPANPVIWQFDDPVSGKCPTFCYRPKECAGTTSCPNRRSCCE